MSNDYCLQRNVGSRVIQSLFYSMQKHGGRRWTDLSADIDPYGYLAKAAGTTLCYTEENAVLYFKQQGTNEDDYKFSNSYHKKSWYHSRTFLHRYILVKPVIFGVGDIIEVHASFMAIPLKQGKFKTTMVQRGITLLDGTFTQVW